ncbi:unnamed protein product [Miscanthus lutarioriparius]|uniref:Reverse transcriptase RNase H-like domain-containing protein n=1 Tax=Miscanthus lutarioriparius TaxID=422564 RepID=A0A811NB64_9POAL|nr:unnamed protein product [Miscanthus lutarioriparius]
MSIAEEKLDALAAQLKSMLLLMETFNRWRLEVDHFSTELSKDVKNLTSRIEALEAQPHPAPPSASAREEEGRAKGPGVESTTQGDEAKTKWDDKLAALRTQRRAQGLCMKCGEKCGKNHKCPDKVSPHVLEEFLEAVQTEPPQDDLTEDSSDDDDDEIFSLSQCAVEGVQGKKTIKLSGLVNHQEILILIDSGSSCSFISDKTVQALQCSVTSAPSVLVTVANGQKLRSDQQVQDFTWWTQGKTFTHSVRVLSISCFDLVLGMDWLESHSPMWIHWKRKLLRFSYQGARVSLKGIKDSTSTCPKIKLRKFQGLVQEASAATIPTEVQQLIKINDDLFQDPKSLPPERTFDHKIPLIPVLSQNHHPIAYISKSLGPKAQAMSTYEKECMALILAVTKWKSYLQHMEFTISIDHHSLVHLGDQKLLEGMQHKAFIKLLGLQYKIIHKKGWKIKLLTPYLDNLTHLRCWLHPQSHQGGWTL